MSALIPFNPVALGVAISRRLPRGKSSPLAERNAGTRPVNNTIANAASRPLAKAARLRTTLGGADQLALTSLFAGPPHAVSLAQKALSLWPGLACRA